MPSLFWPLLTWQELAPTLIRFTLAAIFLHWAYREFKSRPAKGSIKTLASLEAAAAILLIIGLWVQAAALFLAIDLIFRLVGRASRNALFSDGINYYFVLLIMALSLLVLGAGFFSFDLSI